MKKIFVTLMASMLLLSSTTYATEKFGTLNKADSQALFGNSSVNTLALGQNEMMETEGEWFFTLLAIFAIGTIKAANAPTRSGQSAWHGTNGYPHAYSKPGHGWLWNW